MINEKQSGDGNTKATFEGKVPEHMSDPTPLVDPNALAKDSRIEPIGDADLKRKITDVTPDPNIIFVGRTTEKNDQGVVETVPAIAPLRLRDGRAVFNMPASDDQTDGFYHADAARIIRAFPQLYKRFQKKGV